MDINGRYLTEAAQLEKKWSEVGLLEGIEDKDVRRVTAVMLENQHLFNEIGTDSGDVDVFRRISIPLVRRIYPQLIANKIVSVQPLLGPTGLVYYLRFRYATNKGSTRGGTQTGTYLTQDDITMQQKCSGDANLDIWYAHQKVNDEPITVAHSGTAINLEHAEVLSGTISGSFTRAGTTYTFTLTGFGGTVAGGACSISPAGSNVTAIQVTAGQRRDRVTYDSWTAPTITFTYTGADNITDAKVTYEYDMECNPDQPEVNLTVESEEVVAKTRKLKAVWSFEAQQDLRSQHNLEAEAELTAVLAQEVNLEIDREILTDLRTNAGTVATWDFATALGDTIKEKYESLYVKVTEVSNVIHRKTLKGGANWIVTSPEVCSIFETATAGFTPAPSDTFQTSLGIQYIGVVNNRWRVYKDPLFPTGQLLMGYKGDSNLDAGYFYCPYVPLTQTPVVLDPESLCPRKGLMTRYGKKLLRCGPKFYARLNILNFIL